MKIQLYEIVLTLLTILMTIRASIGTKKHGDFIVWLLGSSNTLTAVIKVYSILVCLIFIIYTTVSKVNWSYEVKIW